ncbi:RagB/SusD family nutrient uptake outer membrane protein [Antarcticibacterium arcticum]|uniref:RagB/SusD family nutrient uptake outer membrane protein n=1 Tax=Antarcticibacterium arcticum TaxID=2585771 RepID=A0A5B8YQD6_9FLAO|nr:RagB/SusD family nutrient uptake outer membrane protein [Antarcticibacterium arcticum]QED38606.1 RagB/SusD family nutrient uptake outer membrane protein [Antarcticibacterium arcticum]
MKTHNFKLILIAFAVIFTMNSCSEDFLEVPVKGSNLESNYYKNETEAFAGLVAVYDVMRKYGGGFENMITFLNAGSDDFRAGGGNASDGIGIQSFDDFNITPTSMPQSYWSDFYQGIFRANFLLSKLPAVPMDENLKSRFTAETKALRALYYFELVRLFENIPLITRPLESSEFNNVPQVPPADVYNQIVADLLVAIDDLPPTIPGDQAGRFNKGAAQALLGKVYLQLGLNSEAAAQLREVNGTPGETNQYGNKLLENFGDLWVVDNKFNTESILEAAHTNASSSHWGNWGSGADEGNSVNTMVGPRSYSQLTNEAPDLPSGWSFNPVEPELYNLLENDPRFDATILDMQALVAAGAADYLPGYEDTGYFLKKFLPTQDDVTTGTGEPILNYRQNVYVIRLADTYLMEAEALGGTGARAQALLDAVRARVGLPSIQVSLTAIYAERRLELAGEGHRFFDLVRTGRAAQALGDEGYQPTVHYRLPIPYRETQNTIIEQNSGYQE